MFYILHAVSSVYCMLCIILCMLLRILTIPYIKYITHCTLHSAFYMIYYTLNTRPFRTYRGVRFIRSQIYLLFDVSAIQKLTILSVRVWSLANARKNRLKSPFSHYYRKNIRVRLRLIAKFQLC